VLTAAAGAGQVSLSWTTPADGGSAITGYRIYRSTSSGTEVWLTTMGVVNGYTDSGLSNGTTYWYQVSAVNVVGESVRSVEKSAKPVTAPSAPRSLTAAPHRTKGINLTWQVPLSDGGSAITGYRIYRSTTSLNETLLTTVGVVTSYRDSSTTKNVRYYYVVRAFNAVNNSAASNEATAIAK
jgi:fibronectin type 3 domain-containing protein